MPWRCVQKLMRALDQWNPVWLPIAIMAGLGLIAHLVIHRWRWIAFALLLTAYAWTTRQYVPVWQSDVTLWRHAVIHAPTKPRPWVNYGLALLRARRYREAELAFLQAREAAVLPHVPAWDRREALQAVAHNLEIALLAQAVQRLTVRPRAQ